MLQLLSSPCHQYAGPPALQLKLMSSDRQTFEVGQMHCDAMAHDLFRRGEVEARPLVAVERIFASRIRAQLRLTQFHRCRTRPPASRQSRI
eukprot:363637-Chlamydomonas_euryale.AAC.3